MAEGQESRLMEELGKIRHSMTQEEDKDRRYVFDMLEEKKTLIRDLEELRSQLISKTVSYKELQSRFELMKDQRKTLEEQITQIKRDLSNLTKLNKEALEQ
jgi:hypothetical protein